VLSHTLSSIVQDTYRRQESKAPLYVFPTHNPQILTRWRSRDYVVSHTKVCAGFCFLETNASELKLTIKPVLWNSYLEAIEEEKELAWARIADIFGLNNGLCTL